MELPRLLSGSSVQLECRHSGYHENSSAFPKDFYPFQDQNNKKSLSSFAIS